MSVYFRNNETMHYREIEILMEKNFHSILSRFIPLYSEITKILQEKKNTLTHKRYLSEISW